MTAPRLDVAVIDLGCGNIRSLTAALAFLGAPYRFADGGESLQTASHIILPGVGAFDAAMENMANLDLVDPIREASRERDIPVLGVCLGMQLLFDGSDEGALPGLGLLSGRFRRLRPAPSTEHKVPHVGFSPIRGYQPSGLFAGLDAPAHFYFTHSYALPALDRQGNIALCNDPEPFVAALQCGRVCGVQFHPEKSQSTGLRLLSNFLELA